MTAQELRIGNYVLFENEIFQINSIDNKWTGIINEGGEMNIRGLRGFSPIPLTPEVLEACDLSQEPFKSHLYKNYIRDGSGNYDGYYLGLKYSKDIIIYMPCNIKLSSLHKLQNVYYCLTGQELTIDIDKLKNAVK